MNNDLISRKYIQEQIPELDSYDNGCYIWLKREDVDNLLDNAPTVDPDMDFAKECYAVGYEDGKTERPQGHWGKDDAWRNGEYIGGYWHINCPCVDGYPSKVKYNFCPNCGAKMKGGED